MVVLANAVILGYCDLAAAGTRLLQHVSMDDTVVVEDTIDVHNIELRVRNYITSSNCAPVVSVVIIPTVVPADECTLFGAALTDVLAEKRVLLLTSLSVPMTSDEEACVFWKQYHAATPLSLPDIDFEPIPANRWTIKDQLLCTCLHFFQVEQLETTVLVVRGYKFGNKATDGTAEVLLKLGRALPTVLQALKMASKVDVDLRAAAAAPVASSPSELSSTHSLLYN
ncbi:Aste57867_10717 [Aphanomyces stellatus]|uniref:Aste57867_10717 protein n=1 Tax=Aphanomyces stellatus TaxID=120398 RepID=A0A485KRJ0_9STRA|nr:hypothetical protein As57867_010677 [Aphanomyces stellatus]VFT87587.1 Aste57867_10717 [Aphanomyces stellatus]